MLLNRFQLCRDGFSNQLFFILKGVARIHDDDACGLVLSESADCTKATALALGQGHRDSAQVMNALVWMAEHAAQSFHAIGRFRIGFVAIAAHAKNKGTTEPWPGLQDRKRWRT